MKPIFLAIPLLLIPMAAAWADCAEDVAALRKIRAQAPQSLAEQSARAGDLRYFEWYGYSSAVPGIKNQACVREGGYSKPMTGTSDALCSEEHRALNEGAFEYAEKYNRAIAPLRTAKGLPSCE